MVTRSTYGSVVFICAKSKMTFDRIVDTVPHFAVAAMYALGVFNWGTP